MQTDKRIHALGCAAVAVLAVFAFAIGFESFRQLEWTPFTEWHAAARGWLYVVSAALGIFVFGLDLSCDD